MGRFEPGPPNSRIRAYNKTESTPLWCVNWGIGFQSPYSVQVGTGIREVPSLRASVKESRNAEEQ